MLFSFQGKFCSLPPPKCPLIRGIGKYVGTKLNRVCLLLIWNDWSRGNTGSQGKGNQYLSISKHNHTPRLLSTCCVPRHWALGSPFWGALEDWEAGRERPAKVEGLPSSPPGIFPQLAQAIFALPALPPSTPSPHARCRGGFFRREQMAGVQFCRFIISWVTQGDVGTATGVVRGKPPSPLPSSWERGQVQVPWSWVGPATVVPGPGGLRAAGEPRRGWGGLLGGVRDSS